MKRVNWYTSAAEIIQTVFLLPRQKGSHVSLVVALIGWALLSALAVFIIWEFRDRARLVRDNENERILTTLFASLRDYDDFGAAITENEMLRQRITGFAIYDRDHALVQRWGEVPPVFDFSLIENQASGRFNRYTIPDRRSGSITFVIHNDRPPPGPEIPSGGGDQRGTTWFNVFSSGNYVYINVGHPAYWRTVTVTGILYPFSILGLLVLSMAVRGLYVGNIEYRERIKAQQNLVVLGTAASTLAHEIKNPLHSIKLQTGILRKMYGTDGTGLEEIDRIDEEINRLAALTYRVNDYLRDARGHPETIDIAQVIEETSIRLCGRSVLGGHSVYPEASAKVFMDSERARSVFENIITNAMESGGPAEECGAALEREGDKITVSIFDRGRGISETDIKRVFDPFFTTKSRGTGIGLAVSRRFLEAAGGSIFIGNRPGGGAFVKVVLPCAS
ncbi:MAG: HAMP domain-containing histidine kinase [Treponema sp.]|nr:HAMP domain-containing histidine kinase [Treponema sp.]